MKLYTIYSNQFAVGNKPIGISSLAATLKKAGHQFKLFDCTQFVLSEGVTDNNIVGELSLEYKPPSNPEKLPERPRITFARLCELIIKEIDDFKPDMVGLSALTDDYPLGINILRRIRSTFPKTTFMVGGIHATVDPTGVIRESCVDAICIGEGEGAILDIANHIDGGLQLDGIKNLWVKKGDQIIKNPVRPLLHDLDNSLPYPDWSIWPQIAFYKPYMGYVYKYGDFEMSRGCPFTCSYCINVGLQAIYKLNDNPTRYHREKSIDRVIAEVKWAMEVHNIEFLKFWDETFLLMPPARLNEFHEKYKKEINIPYVIETTAGSCTARNVKILQETNCKSASLGMETGSPDLRKGILNKPTENQVYIDAFQRLAAHGIRPVSFNMLGLPGETKQDIFSTILLNRVSGTEGQTIGIFYPYKGTPIRGWIQDKGLMNDDFEYTLLQQNNFSTFTDGRMSVLKFTDIDGQELLNIKELFPLYCHLPTLMFPLIDFCKNNKGNFRDILLFNLRRVLYRIRFHEEANSYFRTMRELSHLSIVDETHTNELNSKPLFQSFKNKFPIVYEDFLEKWFGAQYFTEAVEIVRKMLAGEIQAEVELNEQQAKEAFIQKNDDAVLVSIRKDMNKRASNEALMYRPPEVSFAESVGEWSARCIPIAQVAASKIETRILPLWNTCCFVKALKKVFDDSGYSTFRIHTNDTIFEEIAF